MSEPKGGSNEPPEPPLDPPQEVVDFYVNLAMERFAKILTKKYIAKESES